MIKQNQSIVQKLFQSKALSYRLVFNKETNSGKDVLKDLAKFCKANETTFHKDPEVAKVLEGRRQVWLRIQEYINLTHEELYDLHVIKERPNG